MSLKEFSVRCSAITLVTANAFGIVLAIGPQLPRTASRLKSKARPSLCERENRFGVAASIHALQAA